MKKYSLTSGKIVELSLSNVDTALDLYRAVLTECKKANLNINDLQEKSLSEIFKDNIEAILNIFASKEVYEAILQCCTRVIYNKQKFSMEIFEEEAHRGDLFPLLQLVAIENLAPFFPQLRTVFDVVEQSILM